MLGELLACHFLKRQGFQIWWRNWRHALGELDIIAFDKRELVIIEVKSRRGGSYSPLDNLSAEKEERLHYLGKLFFRRQERHLLKFEPTLVRLDIVTVTFLTPSIRKPKLFSVSHYKKWSVIPLASW